MVIYLEQGADLHMAQLMQLPLTVSCFSKMQIGLTVNGCVLLLVWATAWPVHPQRLWSVSERGGRIG